MSYISIIDATVNFHNYQNDPKSIRSRFFGLLRSSAPNITSYSALSELNFNLVSGDRLGVFGDNGSGKTTLLRLVSGIYAPECGSVEINGSVSSLIDISFGIDPELTGEENLIIRGLINGLSVSYIKEMIPEILEFSELGENLYFPVKTYSSGMQMRLAFSMTSAISPDILVMDEWLSVGDVKFNAKAESRLKGLLEGSKILIFASHSEHLIKKLCNKFLWLEKGRVKSITNDPAILQSYFRNYT